MPYLCVPGNPYEALDDDEKENIKTLLFIMDRFSISLEGKKNLIIKALRLS